MDLHIESRQDACIFSVGFTAAQILGILCIALAATWTGSYLGGFAWQSNPPLQFNYHPLFMVIGMVFFYGDAIMVFRVLRNERKKLLKLIHGGLQALAFVFTVVALKAVFDSHNLPKKPFPNMYSLHSWLGLATVLLFCLQFVCGFVAFLFPGLVQIWRSRYLPLHVFFGLAIFVMAIATCLAGITEKLVFKLGFGYSLLPAEGVIANLLGVSLVVLGILVVYLVSSPRFRRQPLPEEDVLRLEPHSPVN
uniref:Cytochrome b561 n=1 Tax=Centruroides hentzi TaxID=88313 RepID=A0A2I9LNW2_9SCOR